MKHIQVRARLSSLGSFDTSEGMNEMILRQLRVCAASLVAFSMAFSPLYAQAPAAPNTAPQAAAPPATAGAAPIGVTGQPLKLSLGPDYSKPNPWFPNVIAPYKPRDIEHPVLTNSPRLAQLIQDGKLNLSLEDAIALALENNLDIAVQRFVPSLGENALLLAKSGANGRISFDPLVTANINQNDATTPVLNPLTSGIGVINSTTSQTQHFTTGNFGYQQGFSTGTLATLTFNNSRQSFTYSANAFNPSLSSTLTIALSQPLLNGFGFLPNRRFIIEAKNTLEADKWQFKAAVINDITVTTDDYWNLVYSRAFVKVQQASVGVDQQLYNDNKKQLDIGTMAPIDVVTAESQLANDQQQLIVAQGQQLQFETKLLSDITKDPNDPILRGVEVVPTTPISTTDNIGALSVEDAVNTAFASRPELQEDALTLKNADVEVRATRNSLLPSLNLTGSYSTTGLGGERHTTTTTATGAFVPVLNSPVLLNGVPVPNEFVGLPSTTSTTTLVPGGISDAWDALIHSRFPTFQVGVTLSLPIRNRAAQASNGTAQLNQRQQQTIYQQQKNTIYVAVRNALIALNQNRNAVVAASKARELAQQSFDDEQKRYQLGSSTSYIVVQKSRDLTQAQTVELQDQINLIESVVSLNQAMGRTLESNNISINDAQNGQVTTVPNIPGTPVTPPPAH